MTSFHTPNGIGERINSETVRGRTRYLIAGKGFKVWYDAAQVREASDMVNPYDLSGVRAQDEGHQYKHHLPHWMHQVSDALTAEVPDEYNPMHLQHEAGLETTIEPPGSIIQDNSTVLPYNPTPQFPTEMFSHQESIEPGDYHIDPDKRLHSSDSVSGNNRDERSYPGPAKHLFAYYDEHDQGVDDVPHGGHPIADHEDYANSRRLERALEHEAGVGPVEGWEHYLRGQGLIEPRPHGQNRDDEPYPLHVEAALGPKYASWVLDENPGVQGVWAQAQRQARLAAANETVSEFLRWARHNDEDPRDSLDHYAQYVRPLTDVEYAIIRSASSSSEFQKYVDTVNKGHIDQPAADNFISMARDPMTEDEVSKIYDYVHEHHTTKPKDDWNSPSDYGHDPNRPQNKSAWRTASPLSTQPQSLTPDMVRVENDPEHKFVDVEKDERKTTGPDGIVHFSHVDANGIGYNPPSFWHVAGTEDDDQLLGGSATTTPGDSGSIAPDPGSPTGSREPEGSGAASASASGSAGVPVGGTTGPFETDSEVAGNAAAVPAYSVNPPADGGLGVGGAAAGPSPTAIKDNMSGGGDYTVKPGDTLSGIADSQFGGADYNSLAQSSGISDPDMIHPGDVIKGPGGGGGDGGNPAGGGTAPAPAATGAGAGTGLGGSIDTTPSTPASSPAAPAAPASSGGTGLVGGGATTDTSDTGVGASGGSGSLFGPAITGPASGGGGLFGDAASTKKSYRYADALDPDDTDTSGADAPVAPAEGEAPHAGTGAAPGPTDAGPSGAAGDANANAASATTAPQPSVPANPGQGQPGGGGGGGMGFDPSMIGDIAGPVMSGIGDLAGGLMGGGGMDFGGLASGLASGLGGGLSFLGSLTYVADNDLLNKLRDLSQEDAHPQHEDAHNQAVRKVVDELRDRGYDASQLVAMVRQAAEIQPGDTTSGGAGFAEGGAGWGAGLAPGAPDSTAVPTADYAASQMVARRRHAVDAVTKDDDDNYDDAWTPERGGPDWLDHPFNGTGPDPKYWFESSEDYHKDHDYKDVTEVGSGYVGNEKPKQGPGKTSGRLPDYWDADENPDDPDGEWREDPHWRSKIPPPEPVYRGDKKAAYDDRRVSANTDSSDVVRQFQASAASSALADSGGDSGAFSNENIAARAQTFLKTAGRVYSLAEQEALMKEAHPLGARNLPTEEDLAGTHYLGF